MAYQLHAFFVSIANFLGCFVILVLLCDNISPWQWTVMNVMMFSDVSSSWSSVHSIRPTLCRSLFVLVLIGLWLSLTVAAGQKEGQNTSCLLP